MGARTTGTISVATVTLLNSQYSPGTVFLRYFVEANDSTGGFYNWDPNAMIFVKEDQAGRILGDWNADTNTPTITSSSNPSGVVGDFYQVTVAGTTEIDGESNWEYLDLIVWNGTVWVRRRRDQAPNSISAADFAAGVIWKSYQGDTPAEGNWRKRRATTGETVEERYEGGGWRNKAEIEDSVHSDIFYGSGVAGGVRYTDTGANKERELIRLSPSGTIMSFGDEEMQSTLVTSITPQVIKPTTGTPDNVDVNLVNTDTLTSADFSFNYTPPNGGRVQTVTIETDGGIDRVRLSITETATSIPVYETISQFAFDSGEGPAVPTGVQTVPISRIARIRPNIEYTIRIQAGTATDFKGDNTGGFTPRLSYALLAVAFDDMTTKNTVVSQMESLALENRLNFQDGLQNLPWKGGWNNSTVYYPNDVVLHIENGVNKLWVATQAIQTGQPAPSSSNHYGGAWRELDEKLGRGAWDGGNQAYPQFSLVTHANRLWIAETNRPIGSPAPTANNSGWAELGSGRTDEELEDFVANMMVAGSNMTITYNDNNGRITFSSTGGSGGDPVAPTRYFNRLTTYTVPTPDTVMKEQIVLNDRSGSDLQTVTLWAVTTALQGVRLTLANTRDDVNARVRIVLDAADSITNYFGNIELGAGKSITLYAGDDNEWVQIDESDIPLFPNFPPNPENDGNTFNFSVSGNTPMTAERDLNTAINLEKNTTGIEHYELADPNTSGVTVLDGEGYIFRNIGSGGSAQPWNIFPGGSVQLFIDGTEYTSQSPYSLAVGDSVAIVYGTSQTRYDGIAFDSLIPISSSGAGGASGTSESGMSGYDSGRYNVYNRSGSLLEKGTGVHVSGFEGSLGFVEADNGNFLNAFITAPSNDDSLSTVVTYGEVEALTIYTGLVKMGAPVAQDTVLYWDQGQSRVRTDDESGAHIQCGKINSSEFLYPVTNHAANQTIDTQVEWDAWVEKTNNKDYATAGEFQIPDIAEGSAEVTAVAGQKFIVAVPQGNGTLTLRPRGLSVIINHPTYNPGTLPTYTNANPLSMTGAVNAEYIVIEVNDQANGYFYYALNDRGINNTFTFVAEDYLRRFIADVDYNQSVMIQSNVQDIGTLKNPPATYMTDQDLVRSNITCGTYYTWQNNSQRRTFTIDSTQNVLTNRACRFTIDNKNNSYPVTVINGFGPFYGMNGDRFNVLPGEIRVITMTNENGTYRVAPIGPVIYEYDLNVPIRNNANSQMIISDFPSELEGVLQLDASPNNDQIRAITAIKDFSVFYSARAGWGASTDLSSVHNVSVSSRKNNTATGESAASYLFEILGGALSTSTLFEFGALVANDYVNFNLFTPIDTNISLVAIHLRMKAVLKDA